MKIVYSEELDTLAIVLEQSKDCLVLETENLTSLKLTGGLKDRFLNELGYVSIGVL